MKKPLVVAPMAAASVGLIVLGADMVSCQDYPSKPVRIITATPGGGNDFQARIIAPVISDPLGQPVIVDNRAASQASEAVSKAPPDGYTLLVSGNSFWILPLFQKTPYDVVRDFSSISLLAREISVLVVHPSLPVKSVKELIVLAKAKPGELNYGSGTPGGATYLAAELFKSMASVNIVHIPYKGNASAITAVISGEVQVTIIDPSLAMPHVKSGKLRALAITSAELSALAPGLPTVMASGLPGYEWVGLTGIYAPAKTPAAIIQRLNQEIVRALKRADIKQRFLDAGLEIVGSSPEQQATTIKSLMAAMGKVIKDAGIKAD